MQQNMARVGSGPEYCPERQKHLLQDLRQLTNIKTLVKEGFDADYLLCVECSTDATVKVAGNSYCDKHAARTLRDNLAFLLNRAYGSF